MTTAWQPAFDDLGTPLSEVTFVVVDLETNGLPSHDAGITEIGAVKVRAGAVLGEFQTLVNPNSDIPPFITLLTGINNDMVKDAPELTSALPAFLEWAGESVFVAHNAGFDISFLKAGADKVGVKWPNPPVLDTLNLARATLHPDEVPNRKLGTLAAHFRSPDEPVHRALADARATVHVMHALFERLGSVGVDTLESALEIGVQINAERRKKRTIAEHLPNTPGVYIFRDDRGRALYVGKSANVKKRVQSYFTRSENRSHMGRMVDLAHEVSAIECATELEALVREHRLLLELKPAFNRAGVRTEKVVWLRLTKEEFPRLSAVRAVRPDLGTEHYGPLSSLEQATLVIDAITSLIGLRTCKQSVRSGKNSPSCALAELGRCSAPCEQRLDAESYSKLVADLRATWHGDSRLEQELLTRIAATSDAERYEEAAVLRDRLTAWLRATSAHHLMSPLNRVEQLVAAAPSNAGWDVHVIRHGSLAAAGQASDYAEVESLVAALTATAASVEPPHFPAPARTVGESRMLANWLVRSGAHVLAVEGQWHSNWPSQLSKAETLALLDDSRHAAMTSAAVKRPVRFTSPK